MSADSTDNVELALPTMNTIQANDIKNGLKNAYTSGKSATETVISEVIGKEDRYDHIGITEKLRERVRRREKGQKYLIDKSKVDTDMKAKIISTLSALAKDPLFRKLPKKDKEEQNKVETEKIEEEAKEQLKKLEESFNESLQELASDQNMEFSPDELEDLGLDTDGAFDNPLSGLIGDDSGGDGEPFMKTLFCWTCCCPCKCGYCCCQYTCCLGPTIIWRSLCCPYKILKKFKRTNARSKDMPLDGQCCDKCERSRVIFDDCAFWRGTQTQALFQPTANVPNFTKGVYAEQAKEFEYPMLAAPCANNYFCPKTENKYLQCMNCQFVPNCYYCFDCYKNMSARWFWGACLPFTTCRAEYNLRKKVIDNDMSKYLCFQGYMGVPDKCNYCVTCCKCEEKCPERALCLETCICLPCAASSTRYYVMDKYILKNSPCDNRIIRCNNCLMVTACTCKTFGKEFEHCVMSLNKHFGKGIDPSGYDLNVFKALGDLFTLMAIIFNQTVLGCAAAQVAHEYDVKEAGKGPVSAETYDGNEMGRPTENPMRRGQAQNSTKSDVVSKTVDYSKNQAEEIIDDDMDNGLPDYDCD